MVIRLVPWHRVAQHDHRQRTTVHRLQEGQLILTRLDTACIQHEIAEAELPLEGIGRSIGKAEIGRIGYDCNLVARHIKVPAKLLGFRLRVGQ